MAVFSVEADGGDGDAPRPSAHGAALNGRDARRSVASGCLLFADGSWLWPLRCGVGWCSLYFSFLSREIVAASLSILVLESESFSVDNEFVRHSRTEELLRCNARYVVE